MHTLEGKVAWITGAGSGIGLAGAKELAAAGALVVLSGRREELVQQQAASIIAEGGKADAIALDVADAQAVNAAAQAILAKHSRIDILVNSAGLNVPNRAWDRQTTAGWDQVIRVNLDGSYYCIAAVLPGMRERREGVIINISSWAGKYLSPVTGPAYSAAKHAVVAMTENLNLEECVNGIRACAICPAEVATPILDKRPVPPPPEERARMLQAEDLGRTIRFVAEMPAHACINEIVISPTWNRSYVGAIPGRG